MLDGVVQEVANGLVQEIRNRSSKDIPDRTDSTNQIADTLAKEVAMEVTEQLPTATSSTAPEGYDVQLMGSTLNEIRGAGKSVREINTAVRKVSPR